MGEELQLVYSESETDLGEQDDGGESGESNKVMVVEVADVDLDFDSDFGRSIPSVSVRSITLLPTQPNEPERITIINYSSHKIVLKFQFMQRNTI